MGKYKRYCPACKNWFDAEDNEFRNCTKCGSPVRMIKCIRCDYEWRPHRGTYPTVCSNPRCKSTYYNTERSPKYEHLRK